MVIANETVALSQSRLSNKGVVTKSMIKMRVNGLILGAPEGISVTEGICSEAISLTPGRQQLDMVIAKRSTVILIVRH